MSTRVAPVLITEPDAAVHRRRCQTAFVGGIAGLLSLGALLDLRLIPLSLVAVILGPIGWSVIRRHPQELTGSRWAVLGTVLGAVTLFGGFVVDGMRLRWEAPEGYQPITWNELEPDERTPQLMISERANDLATKKVYLRGYVYPGTAKSNLKTFVLVRDSGTCCFGGQPKLTDMIVVNFVNDQRISYSLWPRGIGGTFQVKPPGQQLSGLQLGAYYLDADYVK